MLGSDRQRFVVPEPSAVRLVRDSTFEHSSPPPQTDLTESRLTSADASARYFDRPVLRCVYGFAIRVGGIPLRLVQIKTMGFAMKLLYGTFVLAVFCCLGARAADVITFETAPDGTTPIDDALLSSPYSIAGGTIRFFFDVNGDNRYDPTVDALPAFEVAGRDEHNAFATAWDNSSDTPRPGYAAQLGSYFLRVAGAKLHPACPHNCRARSSHSVVPLKSSPGYQVKSGILTVAVMAVPSNGGSKCSITWVTC